MSADFRPATKKQAADAFKRVTDGQSLPEGWKLDFSRSPFVFIRNKERNAESPKSEAEAENTTTEDRNMAEE